MGHITIREIKGVWAVRADGAILGESTRVLEMTEDDHAPVLYFPRKDIAMAFFDQTDKVSHCPHKGDATHFSIVNQSSTIENGAWSYEAPNDIVAEIKGHIAFYKNADVQIERL